MQRAHTLELVDTNRLAHSLDGDRPELPKPEVALCHAVGALRDRDRSGCGQALHSRRKVYRVTDRCVFGVQIVLTDRAQQHLTAVQPDANRQWHALLDSQPIGVPLDFLLHPERRVQRPPCVIFLSDRSSEESEDSVPARLRHVALVAVDGVHHELECRIDDRARLLRVEPFHHLDRALDVREERRNRFPLTVLSSARVHRRTLREDALGEVLRGVRARVPFAGFRDGVAAERGSTFPTEFRARRATRPAQGAFTPEGCSTVLAEDRVHLVRSPARGAVHGPNSFVTSAARTGAPISVKSRCASRSSRSR
jgi:hypothetical protein